MILSQQHSGSFPDRFDASVIGREIERERMLATVDLRANVTAMQLASTLHGPQLAQVANS